MSIFDKGLYVNFASLLWVAFWLMVELAFLLWGPLRISEIPDWPFKVAFFGLPVMLIGVIMIAIGSRRE